MKAIVGVDLEGLYESALNLLSRLRLPELELHLVHVVEPILGFQTGMYAMTEEILLQQEKLGDDALRQAEVKAAQLGLTATSSKVPGFAAQTLLETAEHSGADLIAIGSTKKSKYGALFLGSVGRTLTISADQSILIAKGESASEGSIRALFASDYSPYAVKTADYLFGLHPGGFECMTILTASQNIESDSEDFNAIEVERLEKERLTDLGRKLSEKFWEADIPAQPKLTAGDVHEAIETTMAEERLDLLILGAHGHGFWERIYVGSTSLAETVGTPYSVLLLRPPTI